MDEGIVKYRRCTTDSIWEGELLNADIFVDMPDDNEQAFVALALAALKALDLGYDWSKENDESPRWAERNFVADVMAGIREFQISELSSWDPDGSNMPDQFVDEVKQVVNRLRIRHSRKHRQYSVAFDPATKKVLHHYLNQIREVVDKSSDTEHKKDALRACIAALAAEIDFGRAGFEKVTALAVELSGTVREVWENVSPIVTKILEAVGVAKRDEEEQARLPAPRSRKQIEGPKEEAPKPKKVLAKKAIDKQIDDEIPF